MDPAVLIGADPDARSDIYALAATALFAMRGAPALSPLLGVPRILEAVRSGQVPKPSELCPEPRGSSARSSTAPWPSIRAIGSRTRKGS